MRGGPLLQTTDLTKQFGGLVANDRISLSVERGEIRGIIGPNGSGKTTFFDTLTGFESPDSGRVVYDGDDITGWKPFRIARQGLGRTFQIVQPFREMTVRENLLAVPTEETSTARERRADEILESLELSAVAGNPAGEVSGGQQKLLELARLLMLNLDCVLLDEPTAGVNPVLQDRILSHIRELNREGITFVIIEHDMSVMQDFVDTVTVFNQGQIIAEGPFSEVENDPQVREAYLGTSTESGLDSVKDRPGLEVSQSLDSDDPLVATDVVTGYGEHEVLHGVSVRSHEGITCVFGPNGSGKSTLINALNGTQPIWSGTATYGELDISESEPEDVVKAGIATVPQGGGIFERLTVGENLRVGGHLVDEDVQDERLGEVLDLFPVLEEKFKVLPGTLSGGEQMMVAIGRAMMTGADVYTFDEPSAGLQPSKVTEVLELIQMLAEQGVHVVLVEQNVRAALEYADHVYILAQGTLQYDGPTSQLRDEDELMGLYLGV